MRLRNAATKSAVSTSVPCATLISNVPSFIAPMAPVAIMRYRERLARAYPPRPDGITLYPFRRLFFVAVRG